MKININIVYCIMAALYCFFFFPIFFGNHLDIIIGYMFSLNAGSEGDMIFSGFSLLGFIVLQLAGLFFLFTAIKQINKK